MDRKAYVEGNRIKWAEAVTAVAPGRTDSCSWSSLTDMATILSRFASTGCNHVLLPSGGGMDMLSVSISFSEHGCLEIHIADRVVYILKPQRLVLEAFHDAPLESFLIIELAPLPPSGVYESVSRESEELVDLGGGNYVERYHWDQGTYGSDEYGQGLPLPVTARLAVRWLGGQMMMLAKGSLWNGVPGTYDGRHSKMAISQIRDQIAYAIPHRADD